MDRNEVEIAFDIVLEEIENVIAALNQQGSHAFQNGKYDIAKDLIEKAVQMTAFRTKVNELQKEWLDIFATTKPLRTRKRSRKIAKRLKGRLRTPEEAFRIPILQSLIELGESAAMADVLERVKAKMKSQLNDYDWEPLPSDPKQARWYNTAQWTRYALVKEGLLSRNSPRGIWEITSAGKRWLAAAIQHK